MGSSIEKKGVAIETCVIYIKCLYIFPYMRQCGKAGCSKRDSLHLFNGILR